MKKIKKRKLNFERNTLLEFNSLKTINGGNYYMGSNGNYDIPTKYLPHLPPPGTMPNIASSQYCIEEG